jgi:hypothetical protein
MMSVVNPTYKEKIAPLLKRAGFYKVIYEGPVRMMGYSKVLRYDAEFFEVDGPHSLCVAEVRWGTAVRNRMEEIVAIFPQP